jgi:Mg-chelatase subunit ChlI
MNPEEGDLRPQLLDRFSLCVDIRGISHVPDRIAILERNIGFETDPDAFHSEWAPYDEELSDEIAQGRELVNLVTYTHRDLATIATLTGSLRVDGHRADLVILKAARAHAAFEGRTAIQDRDILLAAELALPHRLKRHPFEKTDISATDLESQLEAARAEYRPETGAEVERQPVSQPVKKKPR